MVPVARRNLFQDRTRLLISVGGVALAIFLILLLDGLRSGMYRQITSYVDHSPAGIYVTQKGLSNFLGSPSLIPLSLAEKIDTIEGVQSVSPVLEQYAILEIHNKKVTTFMVGFDLKRGGGPWNFADGRSVERDDEIVVDSVLAMRHELSLGDKLQVMGKEFIIVGLSNETTSWMLSTVFISHDAANSLFLAPGLTSFLLVSPKKTTSVADLSGRIEKQVEGVSVLGRDEVAHNDTELIGGVFDAPIKLMAAIAFVVGSLIVGLTIYTSVVEKVKEYGILKALGMSNWRLYGVVIEQAFISSILGLAGGVVLATGVGRFIESLWPQFLVVTEPIDYLRVSAIALLMAAVSAYLPARHVAKIEPASVFKE
ncbi:MAG: ABC transporter permease [Dehalococcoidia bacterium]|nr:ABC transporter permease [Dehalococcoidia bacterium]